MKHLAMRTCITTVSLMLAALFATLTISGCDRDPAVKVDITHREELPPPQTPPSITYAYLPQYSHATSFMRHGQLVEYLRKATGLPVRQVFPDTFDAHLRMVERGEIDISFSNPVAYIALERSGARAFARIVERSGEPVFRGQLVCRSDNKALRTLEDCKGKRWIAVDPISAGGFLFALGMFLDHDIRPQDFAEIAFAPGPGGKQEKAVLGVHAGRYDFASIREGTLDIVGHNLEPGSMRVLATTPGYPSWVYAARKGLDPGIVAKVREALLALSDQDPEHEAILQAAGMRGIIPAEDRDYDPVRELLAKLGLDPSKVVGE